MQLSRINMRAVQFEASHWHIRQNVQWLRSQIIYLLTDIKHELVSRTRLTSSHA